MHRTWLVARGEAARLLAAALHLAKDISGRGAAIFRRPLGAWRELADFLLRGRRFAALEELPHAAAFLAFGCRFGGLNRAVAFLSLFVLELGDILHSRGIAGHGDAADRGPRIFGAEGFGFLERLGP